MTPVRTKGNHNFWGNKTLNHMEQKIDVEQNFEPYGIRFVLENGNEKLGPKKIINSESREQKLWEPWHEYRCVEGTKPRIGNK
jgi:hypothetical protein